MKYCLKQELSNLLIEFPHQIIGIAVSGGIDSLYLLHNIKQISTHIIVLHINHNTRDSNHKEALFIENVCIKWHIPYKILTNTISLSLKDSNFENKARSIRYHLLEQYAQKNNISVILTAHHLDDLIETVLLKLLRGSLKLFIPYRRFINYHSSIQVIRPMLQISKEEIYNYTNIHKIPYINDPSNKNLSFLRNFFRLKIIPLLYNKIKNLNNKILSLSQLSYQEQHFLQEFGETKVKELFINNICDKDLFLKEHPLIQARVIQYKCLEFKIILSQKQIKNILKIINQISYHSIIIFKKQELQILQEQNKILFIFKKKYKNLDKNIIILHNNILYNNLLNWHVKECINEGLLYTTYDQINARTLQENDIVSWSNGHKKISKILKDKKIPKSKRQTTLVLQKNNKIIGFLSYNYIYIDKDHYTKENQIGLYFIFKENQ